MKTTLFAAAALIGSAAATPSELAQADHFVIKTAEPTHIHAEFHDLGYRNKQTGEKTAETLFYDVATGEALFQLTVGEETSTVQYLDHEPITFKGHHGQTTKEAMLQLQQDGTGYARALGRQALHAHPSFASSIARMAIAVGQRGIYGNSHPAAYYLYTQGMKFEQARRGEHVDTTLAAQEAPESISLLEVEAEETEQVAAEEEWGGVGGWIGTARRRRRRRKSQTGMNGFHGFFNNKNQLYSNLGRCTGGYGYPGNERRARCFGVCGPGCECWIFICGRCDRIYQGCTEHDCICMDKCSGSMKGSPTNSNKSGSGANNWPVLHACNSLNAYQDWGSYFAYAQVFCVYSTQHWWWGDGDCKQMPLTTPSNSGVTVAQPNQALSQWSWRVWVWGVGGHYPGLVLQLKKKAKKFSYFLEYTSSFSVPSNWENSNAGWWTGNSNVQVGLGPVTQGNYYGQGYTYNESGWGIGNHQDFLVDQNVDVGDDFIFVKPYGSQFFPAWSAMTTLGYDSFKKGLINSSKGQSVEWPGCGIDASRLLTGWTAAVAAWEGNNGQGWAAAGHHGYAQPTGDGWYNGTDSNHNLWYYSNGDEKETSKDRWIYGGEGKPNYQKDWNTAPNNQSLEPGSTPPKKKYGNDDFTEVLYNGSFAAVVGDQFNVNAWRPSGTGCLKHDYNNFPTPAPTKAPTSYPTKAPTPFPTKAPTKYPTRYPTTSPTENPNWGDCCAVSMQGMMYIAATQYWSAAYPATNQLDWIRSINGPCSDANQLIATMGMAMAENVCLTKFPWQGFVGMPGNMHSDMTGCEWIPMGGVGNHKCPHKTATLAVMPQSSLPNNSFVLPTVNNPAWQPLSPGGGIPNSASPAAVTYAQSNGNNLNVMGVTLPAEDTTTQVIGGKLYTGTVHTNSRGGQTFQAEALVRTDNGPHTDYASPTDGTRLSLRDANNKRDSGDHGREDLGDGFDTKTTARAASKLNLWRTSGEANYPFYIGSEENAPTGRDTPAKETGRGGATTGRDAFNLSFAGGEGGGKTRGRSAGRR